MIKSAFVCYKFVTKQNANHYICFFPVLGIFATKWKMANVVSIHKRDNKQNDKNYLSTCFTSSSFQKKYLNVLFFLENDLISLNQSSFKQGDYCINQLLSITHDIYQSLDQSYEVRGMFLDISRAFDMI